MKRVTLGAVLRECKRRGISFADDNEFWYRMGRDIFNVNDGLQKDIKRVAKLLDKYKSKSFGFGSWKKSIESVKDVLAILETAEQKMRWVESEFDIIKKLGLRR